ncbi:hypothetical protein [Mycobacterium sp. 050134]|uniref:hypothetical protein n=1 Tax=Mycobacterium sp. 050134 TaxID=3096111 RepID=UPI002ED7A32D
MRRTAALIIAGAVGTATVLAPTEITAAPTAFAGTAVPLKRLLRACDFTPFINLQSKGQGTARTDISASSNTVTAQVQLVAAEPGTHYNVRLIEAPRPSASCAAGDAGVAAGGMDTDATGSATLTLQEGISPNATGAWVFVDRPADHSQTPAEYYTSEIIAPI